MINSGAANQTAPRSYLVICIMLEIFYSKFVSHSCVSYENNRGEQSICVWCKHFLWYWCKPANVKNQAWYDSCRVLLWAACCNFSRYIIRNTLIKSYPSKSILYPPYRLAFIFWCLVDPSTLQLGHIPFQLHAFVFLFSLQCSIVLCKQSEPW